MVEIVGTSAGGWNNPMKILKLEWHHIYSFVLLFKSFGNRSYDSKQIVSRHAINIITYLTEPFWV